jgi:hypothetical protein
MLFYRSKFGPKHMRPIDSDPVENLLQARIRNDVSDGPIFSQTSSSIPSPASLPTPVSNAQDLAGGLSPAQLDQASRFEVEEGAGINPEYGERLLTGNLVSHFWEPGVPRNTFTHVLGDGWSLGKHGDWEGPDKVWYKGEELVRRFTYTEWIRDQLPAGAVTGDAEDGWNWVKKDPLPFLGEQSHQSPVRSGQHTHLFINATETLPIASGDKISVWIWIDPINTPTEIMLAFREGTSFEHRAYWGANSIADGVNGTDSRRQINASIPPTGQWVRLDVPADGGGGVGLAGTSINGIAFLLFGGGATWGPVVRWKDDTSGNTGYVFRPGILATNDTDIIQKQNITSWQTGVIGNGAASLTARLSTTQATEDRPDGLKVRVKCRRVFDFDHTGAEIDYGYSANPARVAADRILHFFERRYRNNIELARQLFRERIYWPSWVEWRDFCDQLIPWDELGDGQLVMIKQFEAHIGFGESISLAGALNQLTGLSATFWQDDGSKLIFLPPVKRDPVHHLEPSNIIGGGVNVSVVDLRQRPNRFIVRFRNTRDPFLGAAAVEPPDFTPEHARRERSIARVGEIRSEREFPNMTFSQAQRLAEYRARIEHDNPVRYSLVGNALSYRLLPGDYVTLSHPRIKQPYQLCLVIGARLRSVEQAAEEVGLELQRVDGQLYDVTAHRARQEELVLL